MVIQYIEDEFKDGTIYRRVFLYEDDGDVIMTDGAIYEDEIIVDHDGPIDD